MSPFVRRDAFAGDHGRARELAAIRLDEPLPAAEDAWLEEHLVGCEACTRVAVEYREQTGLLAALRDAAPEPPRDLWARTAAAIEADASPARRSTGRAGWWRPGGAGRFPVAPVAGLLVVAIAVGAGLLNGINLFPSPDRTVNGSGSPMPTPIAMTAGTVQVLTRGSDGVLELSTRHIDEVCPVGASSCGTTAASDSTKLSTLGDLGSFDAVISPTQDHIVVLQRGDKASGVYVVPVREAVQPSPSTPVATPTPATASPSASVTAPPVSPTPKPTDATATPTPTEPAASPTPTPTAMATPEGSATPSTPAASPDASPSGSIEVTPRPDGTIEIVHDVILVGSVSGYSADGTRFAFAARPADGSAGPDVYVWRTTDSQARSVTADHASVFAGWLGDRLLVSRVTDGSPVTALLDPETGAEQAVAATSMWRPAVAADQRTAVWWEGSVAPAGDGFTWEPAVGRLVLGGWPGLVPDPPASPAASPADSPQASPADRSTTLDPAPTGVTPSSAAGGPAQVLASGRIRDWQVRWDETGTALALWVTDGAPDGPGTLSLYAVDAVTGIVDLARPLLANAPAFDGFSLRDGRLAWSAPGPGGDNTVEVLAWSGDTVGQLQLPTETGVTVIH